MWLYNQGQWKLRWKDPRTFNAKTQAQIDVGKLGIRECQGQKNYKNKG